jgi:hypothetical protein
MDHRITEKETRKSYKEAVSQKNDVETLSDGALTMKTVVAPEKTPMINSETKLKTRVVTQMKQPAKPQTVENLTQKFNETKGKDVRKRKPTSGNINDDKRMRLKNENAKKKMNRSEVMAPKNLPPKKNENKNKIQVEDCSHSSQMDIPPIVRDSYSYNIMRTTEAGKRVTLPWLERLIRLDVWAETEIPLYWICDLQKKIIAAKRPAEKYDIIEKFLYRNGVFSKKHGEDEVAAVFRYWVLDLPMVGWSRNYEAQTVGDFIKQDKVVDVFVPVQNMVEMREAPPLDLRLKEQMATVKSNPIPVGGDIPEMRKIQNPPIGLPAPPPPVFQVQSQIQMQNGPIIPPIHIGPSVGPDGDDAQSDSGDMEQILEHNNMHLLDSYNWVEQMRAWFPLEYRMEVAGLLKGPKGDGRADNQLTSVMYHVNPNLAVYAFDCRRVIQFWLFGLRRIPLSMWSRLGHLYVSRELAAQVTNIPTFTTEVDEEIVFNRIKNACAITATVNYDAYHSMLGRNNMKYDTAIFSRNLYCVNRFDKYIMNFLGEMPGLPGGYGWLATGVQKLCSLFGLPLIPTLEWSVWIWNRIYPVLSCVYHLGVILMVSPLVFLTQLTVLPLSTVQYIVLAVKASLFLNLDLSQNFALLCVVFCAKTFFLSILVLIVLSALGLTKLITPSPANNSFKSYMMKFLMTGLIFLVFVHARLPCQVLLKTSLTHVSSTLGLLTQDQMCLKSTSALLYDALKKPCLIFPGLLKMSPWMNVPGFFWKM